MAVHQMKHTPAPKMQQKKFTHPDDIRNFEKGKVEVVTLGGVTFGRAIFQPGWKWSLHVKPIAKTESCEVAHLNLHISGRLHVVMDDGSEREFGPGEISELPAGHDAWVVGNEPAVIIDIAGMSDYATTKKGN